MKFHLLPSTVTLLLSTCAWSQVGNVVNASAFHKSDCGANIMAAEAFLSSKTGEIQVDNGCGSSTWSLVTLSGDHQTLRFLSPGPYRVNRIMISGNSDSIVGPASIVQVGGVDQNTITVSGDNNQVQNITCDGSAAQPSKVGTLDDCFVVTGSRNQLVGNTVTATQGNGIAVLGISRSHPGAENVVRNNKIYNATASKFGEGIVVGNISPENGSFSNGNVIEGNVVKHVNGDCIYVTADVATSRLPANSTQTANTQIVNNTVSDCNDSGIEASDMVSQTLIQGNVVDCTRNACILTRDGISTQILNNNIYMESSVLHTGIAVGPRVFQSAAFDTHTVVANNVIRGYIAQFAINVAQSDVQITGNDIEDTYRTVGSDGGGLDGEGISCSGSQVSSCLIQGNRIKRVRVGIDFNYGAVRENRADLVATDNQITQVGTGINLYQLRCTNCNFSKNVITQVLKVGIQDNGADGTGTSSAVGNTLRLSGWKGAAPKSTIQNLPGYRK
jgi:Right handed beta helix region